MNHEKLTNCHDCGAKPGETHMGGCDVEHCSWCGGQVLMCGGCKDKKGKMRHDPFFARWTGLWPGSAECMALGLFSKFSLETGWVKTTANDPEGRPDLNTFYSSGLHKIFLVKPTVDRGQERYDEKQKEKQSTKRKRTAE